MPLDLAYMSFSLGVNLRLSRNSCFARFRACGGVDDCDERVIAVILAFLPYYGDGSNLLGGRKLETGAGGGRGIYRPWRGDYRHPLLVAFDSYLKPIALYYCVKQTIEK